MELKRHRLALEATPQDVLRMLRDDERPFLLLGAWAGGGAIAGSDPVPDPPSSLDVRYDERCATKSAAVGGGWFGWLGYGFGATIERLPPQPPRPHPAPHVNAAFYDHVLRMDTDGAWWFEALETPERAAALQARREELQRRTAQRRPWRLDGMTPRAPGFDGHRWAVEDAVRRIAEGELFQANLTLRLEGDLHGDPLDAFADATTAHAPPYAAFLASHQRSILSFSPELFLKRRGDQVHSDPIKGTGPSREALTASAKDAAEHVMIVDLVRNDLGRVARYGTVVAHPPRVDEHPGLFHMVSRVDAETDAADEAIVRAAFPPGSVTGAPKVQAMKVIAALEATGREAYTGAIGYQSPVAGLELSVAIRTLEVDGGHAWLGVGGGIVAHSDPEKELQEALAKARPVLNALGAQTPAPIAPRSRRLPPLWPGSRPDPALGLMETMLAIDGEIPFLDAHLRRLGDDSARTELVAAAETAGQGRHRVRLVDGNVDVSPAGTVTPIDQFEPVLVPGGLGDRKWADRVLPRHVLIVDADGAVLETGSANLFIVEAGRHITPPLDGRLLPGVTRACVIALTQAAEEEIDLDRLQAADAVYLTSSIALVTPVRGAASAPSASAVLRSGRVPSPAPGR